MMKLSSQWHDLAFYFRFLFLSFNSFSRWFKTRYSLQTKSDEEREGRRSKSSSLIDSYGMNTNITNHHSSANEPKWLRKWQHFQANSLLYLSINSSISGWKKSWWRFLAPYDSRQRIAYIEIETVFFHLMIKLNVLLFFLSFSPRNSCIAACRSKMKVHFGVCRTITMDEDEEHFFRHRTVVSFCFCNSSPEVKS